jgi:hypothetical protein
MRAQQSVWRDTRVEGSGEVSCVYKVAPAPPYFTITSSSSRQTLRLFNTIQLLQSNHTKQRKALLRLNFTTPHTSSLRSLQDKITKPYTTTTTTNEPTHHKTNTMGIGCGMFSRKHIAGIPTGAEHAPRKVSRSERTSLSRGRLSISTSGARSANQSRSRGPNGEFRGSVGGLRNGPPVLQ